MLLAFAPPFNLAGVDLALGIVGDPGAHHGHGHDSYGQSGHDQSGLAHHASGGACLQCLVLGGMSLAGAATPPDPAPQLYTIGAGWTRASLTWGSRGARTTTCRGPPALA
jgi:hypothetical protein